jgi:hypothetical protein
MRGTEYLMLVIVISVFGFITIQGATELNEKFTDNPIDTSNFSSYQKIDSIQTRANTTLENFKKLGNEDTAWYQKIGAGIVAIPYAVVSVPLMLIDAMVALSTMLTTGLGGMVPQYIILAMLTILLIYIVRELLQFFQRSRV